MDIPSGTANQETPSQGEPFFIPSFGNVGPPLMVVLSLHGFTIGLHVWLFSSLVIQISSIVSNPNSPSQEHFWVYVIFFACAYGGEVRMSALQLGYL